MKNNELGKNLRELRTGEQISQRDFGKIFGVSNQTVSFWEIGRNEPDLDMLLKIAEYYNVTVDYLLKREE